MENHRPAETNQSFERRKQDHIRLALDQRTQSLGAAGFDFVELIHEALPDINFQDVSTEQTLLGQNLSSPLFISSMTAGHESAERVNSRLAFLAQDKNILMGIGSQRKQLFDESAANEWKIVRRYAPHAKLIGNIGITQLIQTNITQIQRLVESLQAVGLFIHLNSLQEVIQIEGTPQFAGGLAAIEKMVKALEIPVIIKEVGCGIGLDTIQRLENAGVRYIDVSGRGGTHWGRIETLRAEENSRQNLLGEKFWDWGISTVDCLANAEMTLRRAEIWASGGIRTGLDVCKALAMGAKAVGIAQPFLQAALSSELALNEFYESTVRELKTAMFCTGIAQVSDFQSKKVWKWKRTSIC